MKYLTLNKNTVLSALLLVVIVMIVNRIIPPQVDGVFTLVISKNRTSITNIHQARDIEISKTIKVDRINLAEKSRFSHPKLGEIGYANDFFVDVDAPFLVKKTGDYNFYVGSDDGFALSVDGTQLCEWNRDRPLTTDTCHVHLTEGKHNFKLVYFQGFGNAGLVMSYAMSPDGKQYLMGDDSKYMSF
jgi:PA14 domain